MKTLNNKNLDKVLSKNDKVVIDFHADWCGPCRMFEPIFSEAESEYENKNILFARVNVDQESEIAAQYNIRTIPTVIFIDKKKVVESYSGLLPKTPLTSKLESLLDAKPA